MSRWQARLGMGTVLLLAVACTSAVTACGGDRPAVLSPTHQQRLGEGDDPLCPPAPAACYKVRAQGRTPGGSTPFFGVEPTMESPAIWIQPPIRGVGDDGSFAGLVYLGEDHNGARQYFRIYVFACRDPQRLHQGERIQELPADCLASDPVEVYRTR